MRVHVLTLRFDPSHGVFDDSPLQELQRSTPLHTFREHFFSVDGIPHLACVVTCSEAQTESSDRTPETSPAQQPRPRDSASETAELSPAQRTQFETLRAWRTRTAHEEGVPPYVVLTNRHLVQIVQQRPASTTALAQIDGIGRKKIERYGQAVLAALHGKSDSPTDAPAPSPTPEQEPAP